MDGINFIQDLAIVLLAAGFAGVLCKRIGLSVIVGYLAAGLIIGPYTPPFSYVTDVDRIQTLSQLGLVFLMFGIGLGLSLTKLRRMGLPTLLATGLGAFLVLNFTQILGSAVGWSPVVSLFMASMFMISSSAVIAKMIGELNLSHDGAGQRALSITVMEDVVAVVMLTILASQGEVADSVGASVGSVIAVMGAFVVLLVGAGLVLVPRLFSRLEARADHELQTIIVAGVLFLLALTAAKAGYSLAMGAFLLGAIVAELPQKVRVEKAFGGMRDLFSSVFFVSIGMMIDLRLLLDVWPWILGLFVFVMIVRPVATCIAMILCGAAPREARRASLLLSPLGEFSFIIVQLGVGKAVLAPSFYPLAVGVSILTVLAAPLINRHATRIVAFVESLHPAWLFRGFEAYHGWLQQLQHQRAEPLAYKLVRKRLLQVAVEMLFVSGVLIFSSQLWALTAGAWTLDWVDLAMLNYIFWSVIGLLVLVLLLAIWRNILVVAMILAQGFDAGASIPARMIEHGVRSVSAIVLGYWLYLLLPVSSLPLWGWVVILVACLVVVWMYSNRLIYWHSSWQSSVQDVFNAETDQVSDQTAARAELQHGLQSWALRLEESILPDNTAFAGQNLEQLAIPSRFSCSVIEIERNGYVIANPTPDLRVYPGDKLLLLGNEDALVEIRRFFREHKRSASEAKESFGRLILETAVVPMSARAASSLAELQLVRATGVRIVGIERDGRRMINPGGKDMLQAGDHLLVVGTANELAAFRRWLESGESELPK